MALQNTSYISLPFADVKDLADFYKTRLPEVPQVRGIFNNLKLILSLPGDRIILSVSEGDRIYKYTILAPGVKKQVLGWLVYIPGAKRLDLFISETPESPILQWKNRKVVFKNYSLLFDRLGLDKLFDRVVNVS